MTGFPSACSREVEQLALISSPNSLPIQGAGWPWTPRRSVVRHQGNPRPGPQGQGPGSASWPSLPREGVTWRGVSTLPGVVLHPVTGL